MRLRLESSGLPTQSRAVHRCSAELGTVRWRAKVTWHRHPWTLQRAQDLRQTPPWTRPRLLREEAPAIYVPLTRAFPRKPTHEKSCNVSEGQGTCSVLRDDPRHSLACNGPTRLAKLLLHRDFRVQVGVRQKASPEQLVSAALVDLPTVLQDDFVSPRPRPPLASQRSAPPPRQLSPRSAEVRVLLVLSPAPSCSLASLKPSWTQRAGGERRHAECRRVLTRWLCSHGFADVRAGPVPQNDPVRRKTARHG